MTRDTKGFKKSAVRVVTPAELITAIITESGVIPATRDGLASIAGK